MPSKDKDNEKRKIGFRVHEEQEKAAKEEIRIRDVDNSFAAMLTKLNVEETSQKRLLSLEKKIRRELVKLHRRILRLEKKVATRTRILNRALALATERPKEALELLDEVNEQDTKILPEWDKIGKELQKHTLPEMHIVYKGLELANEDKEEIRILTYNLNNYLSTVMLEVNQTKGFKLDNYKRDILERNPHLKA